MSKALTTTKLIEHVVRKASLPLTRTSLLTDDILAFANEELDSTIVPYIMSHKSEYFLSTKIVPLETGLSVYQIPDRAMGNKLRDVSFLDSQGNVYELTQVFVDDEGQYNSSLNNPLGSNMFAQAKFYMENDTVVLVPRRQNVVAGGSLKFTFYLRQSELISETDAGRISAVNLTTGVVTISNLPSTFTLTSEYDIVQAKTPFKCTSLNIVPTAFDSAAKTVTFNIIDLDTHLKVGDYLCLAEETPIPQIPVEIHSLLAQKVVCRCLESMGDQNGLAAAMVRVKEMEESLGGLIATRVEAAAIKVNNMHSFLKRGRYPARWR